jgi:translation elongation factor EF-Tu-like GTPase
MTMPPGDPTGPDLWMTISDVFHIPGRGTVVTGRLEGNVPLNIGDALVCEGASWQVSGIEKFRVVLTTAEPGSNIGVLIKNGPPGDVLRDRTVTFERGTSRFAPRPGKRFWHRKEN